MGVIALVVSVGMTASACATGFTGSPASVSKTGAVLSGGVASTIDGPVQYWFEYGPTTSYGSKSPTQTISVLKNRVWAVSVPISGLQGSTLYHYRLCARDSEMAAGTAGCGADGTFTTQSVECGQTVTGDVTLTGNLNCTTAVGLDVGADGLDIDLAGFTISGDDPGTTFVGIDNTGHDDVVVHDGAIAKWRTAVSLRDASRNKVLNVDTGAVSVGSVLISGGEGNEVRDSSLAGGLSWVVEAESDGLVLADNVGSFAGVVESPDGLLVEGDDARILRNEFDYQAGIHFAVGHGIRLYGSRGIVADNRIGLWETNIEIAGADNAVTGNVVSGASGDGSATTAGASGDGIFVNPFTLRLLLSGNVAGDNEDDGIEVRAPSVRIGGNEADDNGDFGIDAVAGVTDLGGNTASGNGNPLQCRSVFCP